MLTTRVSILDKSDNYHVNSLSNYCSLHSQLFTPPISDWCRFIFGNTFHCWDTCQSYSMNRGDGAKVANLFSSKQPWLWANLHNSHQEDKRPWKWMIMFEPGACHHAPFILCGGGKAINYSINQNLCWLNRGRKVHSYHIVHFVSGLAKLGTLRYRYIHYV